MATMAMCTCSHAQRDLYQRSINPNHDAGCDGWQDWDPIQGENQPQFIEPARTREGYEALCQVFGVPSQSDTEINHTAYARKYANYSAEEWRSQFPTRAARISWKLGSVRLGGIEQEQLTRQSVLPAIEQAPRAIKTCRQCGQTGEVGGYPWSTYAAGGLCDDCL